jgi:hypothetical protein
MNRSHVGVKLLCAVAFATCVALPRPTQAAAAVTYPQGVPKPSPPSTVCWISSA